MGGLDVPRGAGPPKRVPTRNRAGNRASSKDMSGRFGADIGGRM